MRIFAFTLFTILSFHICVHIHFSRSFHPKPVHINYILLKMKNQEFCRFSFRVGKNTIYLSPQMHVCLFTSIYSPRVYFICPRLWSPTITDGSTNDAFLSPNIHALYSLVVIVISPFIPAVFLSLLLRFFFLIRLGIARACAYAYSHLFREIFIYIYYYL